MKFSTEWKARSGLRKNAVRCFGDEIEAGSTTDDSSNPSATSHPREAERRCRAMLAQSASQDSSSLNNRG